MLTVASRALGSRKPLFADFSVPPPDGLGEGGETTLRSIIEVVVRHEVAEFRERQHDRQFLKVLSERQIRVAEATGKIDSGESEVEPQEVDVHTAIGTALEAFQDGIFLVVVDEEEVRELDRTVFLAPDSRLTFIRLTMLAGG